MNEAFAQSQRMMELWTELAAKMTTAGLSITPDAPPPQNGRQIRTAAFQAMSQFADQFMRSPQFLEIARRSLDANLQWREQMTEALTKVRHEMEGVARQDVQSMLEAMHQAEQRVIDSMEKLTQRLDDIARRLDALEQGKAQAPAKQPRRRRGRDD